ncbi:hypothetical protein FGL54_06125 [Enterobacter cloacae]|nr:hypothetical protein [Enterobacter cloacae]MPS83431.1 hypothetical protein [Enterobacter sp.]MUI33285.1 hypothetical protein [Enterobacter cloacae]NBC61735.1 hypothetical protein [Enterobacter cloacae]NBG00623.1 hypothetical protein [Enterobacter cloacae]
MLETFCYRKGPVRHHESQRVSQIFLIYLKLTDLLEAHLRWL